MGRMKRIFEYFSGRHNERGEEVLDRTPVAVPVRIKRNMNSVSDVRALVREELSVAAEKGGAETFEESLDFEVNEDDDVAMSRFEYLELQQEEFLRTGRKLGLEEHFKQLKETFGGDGERSQDDGDSERVAAPRGRAGESGEDAGEAAESGERADGGSRAVGRAGRGAGVGKKAESARPARRVVK